MKIVITFETSAWIYFEFTFNSALLLLLLLLLLLREKTNGKLITNLYQQ